MVKTATAASRGEDRGEPENLFERNGTGGTSEPMGDEGSGRVLCHLLYHSVPDQAGGDLVWDYEESEDNLFPEE